MIRTITVAEAKANPFFPTLAREYAEECKLAGLPHPDEKIACYEAIENTPYFTAFGAFSGEKLVGLVVVLTSVIPHYGVSISVTESLFVAKAYRHTGAGLKLLQAAEKHAKAKGSPGLLVSAPYGGTLAAVLPRRGYRATNTIFFKEFPKCLSLLGA